MKNVIDNVTNNNEIYSEKIGDATIYILNTGIQKNNSDKNISTIDLGECENELKEYYNINRSLSLLMLKIDYHLNDSLIPIIDYELYNPITLELLNLSICNNSEILLNIPVVIDENNLFKYNPNSDYYTSKCFSYTTENGTDIILKDRQKEYGDNNLSLCEDKCSYLGYDSDTKQSSCICTIKNQMEKISEIMNNTNKLSNVFITNKDSISSSNNVISMQCACFIYS